MIEGSLVALEGILFLKRHLGNTSWVLMKRTNNRYRSNSTPSVLVSDKKSRAQTKDPVVVTAAVMASGQLLEGGESC